MIAGRGIFCEIALRWMQLHLSDDKSTLVQVMAWCRQATSQYLNQCWPRSLPPFSATSHNELRYAFYRWTRQRIHNTLIVIDRYLRLMGDSDTTELRLESFYPPFVAGIDLTLPHQGVVNSYNLFNGNSWTENNSTAARQMKFMDG